MSKLIDELMHAKHEQVEICGKWYVAKPLNKDSLTSRLKDAMAILIGKAKAYHYKDAEICTRVGYDLYECACSRCIELDKHRENNG